MISFYIETEVILREKYPTCPRPYFIGSNKENNEHTFAFGRNNYLKAFSEYYNKPDRYTSISFTLKAITPAELAEGIYILAVTYELDETKFLSNIKIENEQTKESL